LIAIAGVAVGIALLRAGNTFSTVAGIATCGFVVTVGALSLSVWLARRPRPEDAVEQALATALQHAHVGVRHAASIVWALAASMVFAATMALARGWLSETPGRDGYVAIGGIQLAVALSLALAFRYYQARRAALARLEAIVAALDQ
jgi:hypothetical protein